MTVERIGDATLYLGDCLEILLTLDKVDAVVTDPPYGIGRNNIIPGPTKNKATDRIEYGSFDWDKDRSVDGVLLAYHMAEVSAFFGGNYYADVLPRSRGWVVWDKNVPEEMDFSGFEMIYTSLDRAAKMYRYTWNGMLKQKPERRVHPTQKPVTVMEWLIKQFKDNAPNILDPFMGSGTTGVACANLGRKFIGIEIEPKYFDIACERITAAYAQGRLFE